MIWIDMLAGLLAAALSGLGVGSGGLLVVYLTLCAGLDQRAAQGVNLLFFLFSGGAALAMHMSKRRLFPGVILWLTLFGIGGSFLGVALSHILPQQLLRKLFGGLLAVSGAMTLLKRRKKAEKEPLSRKRQH